MFNQFIKKVKVEDLTPKRKWFLEYLWSFLYALLDTLVQIVSVLFYLFLFGIIYHFSNNLHVSLMIVFFSLLGGNQFSKKNIKQVEKKMGYKIFD